MIYALSISGGKDSAALWSWAKRTGIGPRRAIACATMWEAKFPGVDWDAYLDELATAMGEPLTIVQGIGFAARVLKHSTFPGRMNRRWCTPELKLEPFKAEVDRIREETGDDVTVVVGVRAEESEARAKMPEREWSDFYDCEMWRPMLAWTLDEVIAEHHRGGIPINPLYKLGAERVGCWPCIKAGKLELSLLGRLDPDRVQLIRDLEAATDTTMFCLEQSRRGGGERKLIPTPIDGMIDWARTGRGGLQLPMFQEPSGCARWGSCEAPAKDSTPSSRKDGAP